MKTKFWCFFLLIALCFSVLVGCGGAGEESKAESEPAESSETSHDPSEDNVLIETDEFRGDTIKVFSAAVNSSYVSEIGNNENSETCAEVLAKAIVARTQAVEEAYGVEIEETIMVDSKRYNGTFLAAIRDGLITNTLEYDIIYPCVLDAATMAAEGILIDLNDAPGIRVENTWWSQTFIEDTSIGGHTFYLTGDIGLRAKNAAGCYLFNKQLFDNNNIPYPYDDVRNRKWTLDGLYSIIKQVDMSNDLDGDKVITYHDDFGIAGQRGDLAKVFYGAGERIASVGADGMPTLTFYNERSSKVVDAMVTIMQDARYYVIGDDFFNESSTPMNMLLDAFKADHCLFYSGSMEDALKLGDMESEFGILPTPMFDLEQGTYYTSTGAWSTNAYCIPSGIGEDREYRGEVILDALGSYSVDTVATAYYDVVLQYQKLRSQDDVDMLKIITESIGSDLGSVYSIGGLSTVLSNLTKQAPGTMTSAYDAASGKAQDDIENLIAAFR